MKKRLFAVKNRLKKEGVLKTALFSLYSFFYGIVSTVYISLILKRKETDRNKVVFSSNPDFSDNAKSLFLYLQKTQLILLQQMDLQTYYQLKSNLQQILLMLFKMQQKTLNQEILLI